MSANIPAILGLFGKTTAAAYAGQAISFEPFRGPLPYELLPGNIGNAGRKLFAVIEEIRADPKWSKVYFGELADYKDDHSSADLALCGELARRGLNFLDIDKAIRTSALYRDKWDRDDYRSRTINKALEGANARTRTGESAASNADTLSLWRGRITINMDEPSPREYVLHGLLTPGRSAVLAGFGGVSKTQLAIQLAVAVALGESFAELRVQSGMVQLYLGEEDEAETQRRINAVARHKNLDVSDRRRLENNLYAFSLVGAEFRLTEPNSQTGLAETQRAEQIIQNAREAGHTRLIILDHMGLLHGGDFNAREDAAVTMRVVNRIAQETGAAVLVLAHTPKSANASDESNASMIAGSTAFVDQARGAWVLATMREKEGEAIPKQDRSRYVSLAVVKNNYGPSGDVIWFERVSYDGVGLLQHLRTQPTAGTRSQQAQSTLDDKIVAFVSAYRGQFSKTSLRDTQFGKDCQFKASKGRLAGAIEQLIAEGRLINRPPTAHERTTFDLGPQVKQVLDVGSVS